MPNNSSYIRDIECSSREDFLKKSIDLSECFISIRMQRETKNSPARLINTGGLSGNIMACKHLF